MAGFTQKQSAALALASVAFVALLGLGYMILSMPDQRSMGTKIDNAIEALPQGLDKAAEQLNDRTTGEKIEDAAQNLRNDVNKSLNRQ